MKSSLKTAVLLIAVLGGNVIAEEKEEPVTVQQAMAHAKKMDAKERSSLMEQTHQIDEQIAELQARVRSLQSQLAQSPRYLDNPSTDWGSP